MDRLNDKSFRTVLKVEASPHKVEHAHRVLTLGSCFAQSMGERFERFKFQTLTNPFGTVYNPMSIFHLLSHVPVDERKFVTVEDVTFHLDYHSIFRAKCPATLAPIIHQTKEKVAQYLRQTHWLIITLGTARVYTYRPLGQTLVANCHKLPQSKFSQRWLTLEEMKQAFAVQKNQLKQVNASLKIIFTISPVRHAKDGLSENSYSKSLLRVFCEAVKNQEDVFYFPAYELMMDDLRDYRFYQDDMIHPTTQAEAYIWQKFEQAYCSEATQALNKSWAKMLAALSHKPFNPDSPKHQAFLTHQLSRLEGFVSYFDISAEKRVLTSQLTLN